MKIILIASPTTFEYLVPLLEADNHDVLLLTGNPTIKISARGAAVVNYVVDAINTFNPDLVINAVTHIFLPDSSDYTYIGNTDLSAQLETHKWAARTKALELGWLLPTLLEECKMNAVSDYDRTVYVKPKGPSPTHQIYKLTTDLARTTYDLNQSASTIFNEIMTNEGLSDIDAYVEDSVDYEIEAWCFFTVSNGGYSIIRTLGCIGYGNDKLVNNNGNWRDGEITLVDLTETQRTAWIAKCEAWLDYAVTLGGNYEGTLGGAITADNSVYWFEQNSRPGTHNIGMLPGSVQDWIDGLTTDSTKSINQISAATIRNEKGFG
tara:strand:+ start:1312 stop:2274 length:963 start_codon:yes stop_codon:yes gene_type:complete